MVRRRMGNPPKRKPQLLSVRRWAELLNAPLMHMKFVLATRTEFAELKSHEYLTDVEAHKVAAAVRAMKP